MSPEDVAAWTAAYAACLGGMLSGPHGAHYSAPNRRPAMDAEPYAETVSHTCRAYADRAVVDFRKSIGGAR